MDPKRELVEGRGFWKASTSSNASICFFRLVGTACETNADQPGLNSREVPVWERRAHMGGGHYQSTTEEPGEADRNILSGGDSPVMADCNPLLWQEL